MAACSLVSALRPSRNRESDLVREDISLPARTNFGYATRGSDVVILAARPMPYSYCSYYSYTCINSLYS